MLHISKLGPNRFASIRKSPYQFNGEQIDDNDLFAIVYAGCNAIQEHTAPACKIWVLQDREKIRDLKDIWGIDCSKMAPVQNYPEMTELQLSGYDYAYRASCIIFVAGVTGLDRCDTANGMLQHMAAMAATYGIGASWFQKNGSEEYGKLNERVCMLFQRGYTVYGGLALGYLRNAPDRERGPYPVEFLR